MSSTERAESGGIPAKLTAEDVKEALRRRYPAAMNGSMVGQWTCIEEWEQIDLIALNAWQKADVIGHEVKISRSDYRQEILKPAKRERAVAICTEFYFAVPAGMLRPDEIAYDEPEWESDDWHRMRCPGLPSFGPADRWAHRRHQPTDLLDVPPGRYGGACRGRGLVGSYKAGRREKGPFTLRLPVPLTTPDVPDYVTIRGQRGEDGEYRRLPRTGDDLYAEIARWAESYIADAERAVLCPTCGGKGYLAKSRVEAEAPTLWVPRDVGLIEVSARGCRIVKPSPKRPDAPGLLPNEGDSRVVRVRRKKLHEIVRWTSNRPDPRHLPKMTATERLAA